MATFTSPSSFPPLFCCDHHHKPLGFPISYHFRQIQRPTHHRFSKTSIQLSPTTPLGVTRFRCFSSQGQRQPSEQKPRFEEDTEDFEVERLFSNLNRATLKREPGSVTSSVLLVAGTTVGAGILAIPAVTQEAGFLAAAITCILCWIYMVVTGLLIAEVNVKTMCELGSGGVSLVSMATRTLGTIGVQITCWSYIFIHYALLVAYVARSSDILTKILGIPIWECASLFSFIFGSICYFGSQRLIGAVNGVLVSAIIISFAALVVVASGDLHWDALLQANLQAIPASIPIIALSFVYQNVVPVLCTNLEGDLSKIRVNNGAVELAQVPSQPQIANILTKALPIGDSGENAKKKRKLKNTLEPSIRMMEVQGKTPKKEKTEEHPGSPPSGRTSIVLGTAIPLGLFLIWNAVILGTITSPEAGMDKITDPLQELLASNGVVGPIVGAFSLLAIATSYIGFVLGLTDFLSDLLKLPSDRNRPLPYLLTLFPPLILSLLDPDVFFKALDFAGTYGVLVLFGVLPAAMSWSDRYSSSSVSSNLQQLVPGGRFTLSLVIGGAGYVILSELIHNLIINTNIS